MTRLASFARLIATTSLLAAAYACGSRTGLLEDVELDGAVDAPAEDVADVVTDVLDASRDVVQDVPQLDVNKPDVIDRTGCADASQSYIYVITSTDSLWYFDPVSGAKVRIGQVRCPGNGIGSPFSMAVDRRGIAYVLFSQGDLFRVSTATAACTPTGFTRNQQGFSVFGMGFSSDTNGPQETLYVASDGRGPSDTPGLGRINVANFVLNRISAFNPEITGAELTGTGDGKLYAFYRDPGLSNDSWIGQLDKVTGQVTSADRLTGLALGAGWAFAAWASEFYLFTAPANNTVVTRYNPVSKSRAQVTTFPETVVGAGVSTCAPQ